MKRIFVIVEGHTEEVFVKTILKEYLLKKGILEVNPIKIKTSKYQSGGFVNYLHLKNIVEKLLKEQNGILVTTLFDYFRIPNNTPGYNEIHKKVKSLDKVQIIENAIAKDIANTNHLNIFIPYIQLHEFEALLFSSAKGFKNYFHEHDILDKLEDIISSYANPEDINDNPKTAPSKRLKKIIKNYDKVIFGNIIAMDIGIDVILNKCPRFKKWVNSLIKKSIN